MNGSSCQISSTSSACTNPGRKNLERNYESWGQRRIHFGVLSADRAIKGENVRSSRLSCQEMQEVCCDRLNGRDPNRFRPRLGLFGRLTPCAQRAEKNRISPSLHKKYWPFNPGGWLPSKTWPSRPSRPSRLFPGTQKQGKQLSALMTGTPVLIQVCFAGEPVTGERPSIFPRCAQRNDCFVVRSFAIFDRGKVEIVLFLSLSALIPLDRYKARRALLALSSAPCAFTPALSEVQHQPAPPRTQRTC